MSNFDVVQVVIEDGVTEIGESAFEGWTNMYSVTIPASVTEIGNCAFMNTDPMDSVTIPDSVTKIGEHAFDSAALTSVTILNPDAEVAENAFPANVTINH